VVLDVDKNIVLLGFSQKLLVVFKQLDCRLCNEDVDTALDGVKSDWVVGCVGGEYGNFASQLTLYNSVGQTTYWRCPWEGRQLRSCMTQGRSFPPWEIPRKTHRGRCMPLRCSSEDAHL
jgi:hypothetical protein